MSPRALRAAVVLALAALIASAAGLALLYVIASALAATG